MDEAQSAAQAALEATVEECDSSGLTTAWRVLIRDIYSANLDRYEPGELGDTAMALGIQCAENLKMRAVRRFQCDDIEPRDRHWDIKDLRVQNPGNVLTFSFRDERVVTMKIPFREARAPQWDRVGDWEQGSQIRLATATENSRVLQYRSHPDTAFTLFPHTASPGVVHNYMLLWAGEPEMPLTAGWLSVPVLGDAPFIAMKQLWWDEPPPHAAAKPSPDRGPRFDQRPAAAPKITPKRHRQGEQA